MIRFFRKIRDEMLGDRKAKQYFFYAIGEISLVVVGILLAVQVNNWNIDRQLELEETHRLESVLESLKEDSVLFNQVQLELNRIDQLHRSIYEFVEEGWSADSISDLRLIRRTILYTPVTLVNHPDLANELNTPELQKAVRYYYQKEDDTEIVVEEFNIYIEDVLRTYLSEIEAYNYSAIYEHEYRDLVNKDQVINKSRFLEELEEPYFLQMLFEVRFKYGDVRTALTNLQIENEQIILLIESYLNK